MARCWDVATGKRLWSFDFDGGNPAILEAHYSPDGEREAVTFPFESAALDSTVFTALAPLDALVGGRANLGNVSVEYESRDDCAVDVAI